MARASSPIASPTRSSSAGSQVAPRAMPTGKAVALPAQRRHAARPVDHAEAGDAERRDVSACARCRRPNPLPCICSTFSASVICAISRRCAARPRPPRRRRSPCRVLGREGAVCHVAARPRERTLRQLGGRGGGVARRAERQSRRGPRRRRPRGDSRASPVARRFAIRPRDARLGAAAPCPAGAASSCGRRLHRWIRRRRRRAKRRAWRDACILHARAGARAAAGDGVGDGAQRLGLGVVARPQAGDRLSDGVGAGGSRRRARAPPRRRPYTSPGRAAWRTPTSPPAAQRSPGA